MRCWKIFGQIANKRKEHFKGLLFFFIFYALEKYLQVEEESIKVDSKGDIFLIKL